MPMLDVDGVGLAYDDVGRRDGVPLVFIHGWTANRHRWDDQVGHFAGRYRVISLDLRGHGDSDRTPDLYTIRGLAREVLALLDGLGVDRFVPVGHSMGGMIALTLALEHPRRVERLVVVSIRRSRRPSCPAGILESGLGLRDEPAGGHRRVGDRSSSGGLEGPFVVQTTVPVGRAFRCRPGARIGLGVGVGLGGVGLRSRVACPGGAVLGAHRPG